MSLIDNLSFLDVMENITSPLELSINMTYKDVRHSLIKVANAFLDKHHHNFEVMRLFVSEWPAVSRTLAKVTASA